METPERVARAISLFSHDMRVRRVNFDVLFVRSRKGRRETVRNGELIKSGCGRMGLFFASVLDVAEGIFIGGNGIFFPLSLSSYRSILDL